MKMSHYKSSAKFLHILNTNILVVYLRMKSWNDDLKF